jgi:hypothetical protein
MQSTTIFSEAGAGRRIERAAAMPAHRNQITGGLTPLRLELLFFALILAIANAPLPGGVWQQQLVFFPGSLASGEWWRLVTHPLVHVSWYHLLLDGAAFLMLYAELGLDVGPQTRGGRRFGGRQSSCREYFAEHLTGRILWTVRRRSRIDGHLGHRNDSPPRDARTVGGLVHVLHCHWQSPNRGRHRKNCVRLSLLRLSGGAHRSVPRRRRHRRIAECGWE